MLNELLSFGPWTWVAIAVLLFVLETVVPGVYLIWFGLAAFVVGVLILLLEAVAPGAAAAFGWQWQLVVFAVLAGLAVFLVKQFAGPGSEAGDAPGLNTRAEQYVGRVFTLGTAIERGRGKVQVGDTLWLAEGPDLPAGSRVKVVGATGTVLRVEAAG